MTFDYEAMQDDEIDLKVGQVITDVQNVSFSSKVVVFNATQCTIIIALTCKFRGTTSSLCCHEILLFLSINYIYVVISTEWVLVEN